MIDRIDESIEMKDLPTWLKELWDKDPHLARRAEKDYLELKSKAENLPISDVMLLLPSNEDLVDEADLRYQDGERHSAFITGARWMRATIITINRKIKVSEA